MTWNMRRLLQLTLVKMDFYQEKKYVQDDVVREAVIAGSANQVEETKKVHADQLFVDY